MMAVQLPGREARVNEAFIANMDDLIGGIVEAMTPWLGKPYVIFGHSFGAIAGFEATRELRRRGLNQPLLLVPAGRQAPHLQDEDPPIASLPEEAFIAALQKDYGEQIGPVLESAELREVFIPQIRADFSLAECYSFRAEQPLDCPIAAFAGVSEKDLATDELNAWSAHTSRNFRSRRFPGDHFFIRESQALVIDAIAQEIASVRGGRIARVNLLA